MEKKSKLLNLDKNDFIKGLIVSVASAFLVGLMQSLDAGHFPQGEEWKVIAISALGAGVSYLAKNLSTNSEGKILKKEK